LLANSHDLRAGDLMRIDTAIGEHDMRAPSYLPAILSLRSASGLSAKERRALTLLAGWDGRAYAPGARGGSSPVGTPAANVTDGPAATLFVLVRNRIKARLFGGLPKPIRVRLDTLSSESHQYDVTPLDNLVLRVIRPGWAGLAAPTLVSGGHRNVRSVLRHALDRAIAAAVATYGANPSSWRRQHGISHLESLTGAVGPSMTMPFVDRGSWVQEVAFTRRVTP
jgi:hypothetical protein